MVYGVACDETPDRQKEIWDYESSAPLWKEWSDNMASKTDGENLGNVRGMHGTTAVAAGMLKEIDYDDAKKQISVAAHIVDDNEWDKVVKKVYTGFSTGGKYVRRWWDEAQKGIKRVTIMPTELALADLPANPAALFEAVKADGITQQRAGTWADEEEPIELDLDLLQAAGITSLKMAKRDGVIPKNIDAKVSKGNAKKVAWVTAQKGMYEVVTLAQIVQSLCYMAQGLEEERDREGDESDVPERFSEAVTTIAECFVDMAHEETAELLEQLGLTESPKGEKAMKNQDALKAALAQLTIAAKADGGDDENKGDEGDGEDLGKQGKMAKKAYKMVGACKDAIAETHKALSAAHEHIGKMSGDVPSVAGKAVVAEPAAAVDSEMEELLGQATEALKTAAKETSSLKERLALLEDKKLAPRSIGAGGSRAVAKNDDPAPAAKAVASLTAAQIAKLTPEEKEELRNQAFKAALAKGMPASIYRKASQQSVRVMTGIGVK